MLAAGVILAFLSLAPSAQGASFCSSFFHRLYFREASDFERLKNPALRYTGYHSGRKSSGGWTPERFQKVTEQEGLYAPIVRSWAGLTNVSLPQAAAQLAYIRTAPPDLMDFLATAYRWEGMVMNSPFISTSRDKAVAASFGPFGYSFGYKLGNAVIFSIDSSKLLRHDFAPRRGLRAWEFVDSIGAAASRGELASKFAGAKLRRAEAIWDWLEDHDWMKEFTLRPNYYKSRPDEFKRALEEDPRPRFHQYITNTFPPGIGDLAWMHFLEKETTVLLHVPPEAITKATLHDERGRVIRTHRGSKSDPKPK